MNSKRICAAPLFESAGVELPEVPYTLLPTSTHVRTSKFRVFYLMLDPDGGLELSQPVIEDEERWSQDFGPVAKLWRLMKERPHDEAETLFG